MSFQRGLEYIETIEPTFDNARAIQELTLQDVRVGRFSEPLKLADPANTEMVAIQQQKLRDHPERYSGYVKDGQLVAYIKQNHWTIADELPFVSGRPAAALRFTRALRLNPSFGQWGIFGLVASEDLPAGERQGVLTSLLRSTFTDPQTGKPRKVNVVIHDNDPLLSIAERYGFVKYGKKAPAAGAPGLDQFRYQRLASH